MSDASNLIRILAVDDHALIREGIARLVEHEADMQIVAEAENGEEALQRFREHRPDITLMDLQMPQRNGLDATMAIRNEFPSARIIVLTTYPGDAQALRALKAGAQAYLLKTTLNTELRQNIRAVHAGRKCVSAEISYRLAEHATDDELSAMETRVLRLISAGNANKEIAVKMAVSEETVKAQVSRILSKLHANDRTHAVVIGLQRGIIDL
jgi:DNA-binding NarL/FixJ family response regulator